MRYSYMQMAVAEKTEKTAPWVLDSQAPTAGAKHLQWLLHRRVDAYPGGPKALAYDLGVSQSTISNWHRGVRGDNMSPDHVVGLARLLNLTTDHLLGVMPLPAIDAERLQSGLARVEDAAVALAEELRGLRQAAEVAHEVRESQK